MKYQDYIEIAPGRRSGKPCINQTRIAVYDVLGWLANGMSAEEITVDFPELSTEAIQACLSYAAERERHLTSIRAA